MRTGGPLRKRAALSVYSLAAPRVLRRRNWRGMMASSAPTADDSAPYADRRAYPRVEVALPAFLQAEGQRHSVQLLDLSAGGAKLDCPIDLPSGTEVTLDCGTFGRSAVVRWRSAGVLGLSFDSELDAREVSALVARSKALAARRKTRA